MGLRGPRPQPTQLRVLNGNPGKRPLPESEPEPQSLAIVPDPPDWLGDIARQVWIDDAPRLRAIGLLTELDLRAFALYCEAWQELFDAKKQIDESGLIATSEKGGEYQHPAVGIKNKAIERIRRLGAEFGMTPSSRTGITVNKETASPKSKHFTA